MMLFTRGNNHHNSHRHLYPFVGFREIEKEGIFHKIPRAASTPCFQLAMSLSLLGQTLDYEQH